MKRTTTLRNLRHASGALLFAAVVAVALTGCVKGSLLDPDGPDNPQTAGTIRIGSAIEASSKAPATDNNALTGVWFLRRNVASAAAPGDYSGLVAILGDRAADGNITFAARQTYTMDNRNAWFLAFWPGATETPGSKTDWVIDGKTDILVSDEYDAGNNSEPLTGAGGADGSPLTLRHQLAQLAVVCKADPAVAYADVVDTWGQIKKIELLESSRAATLTYATSAMSFEGTSDTIALLQPDYQTAFATISMPLKDNATVNAAAMVAPTAANTVRLRVTTEKRDPANVTVTFPAGATFEKGKRHTVPLVFRVNTLTVEPGTPDITAWADGYNGTTDQPLKPMYDPIISYGIYPFAKKKGSFNGKTYILTGSTTTSYYVHKDFYSTPEATLAAEPPFHKFEVAMSDHSATPYPWMGNDRCATLEQPYGSWRMPRLSELMLMYLNRAALEKIPGFRPFTANYYWCFNSSGEGFAYVISFGTGAVSQDYTSSNRLLRCIKEIK